MNLVPDDLGHIIRFFTGKLLVKKYPDFERGESASETGRIHIPPRLFKEAVRLNRQKDKIARLLSEITPLNAKKKTSEIEAILSDYIPSVEKLMTRMKKANSAVKELRKEIADLERQVDGSKASVQRQLELAKKLQEFEALQQTVQELEGEIAAIVITNIPLIGGDSSPSTSSSAPSHLQTLVHHV